MVTFTKIFDKQVKKYGLVEEAVRETIRICRDRNVLKKYLGDRENEVVDIMLTLFCEEEIWDMHVRSREKEVAIKTVIEEGRHYGASKEYTTERIREKFNISQNNADIMMKRYW